MWIGFVAPITMALCSLSLIFKLCGARARKYPALLFAIGFVTALSGVAMWWFTEIFAHNLIYICSKISPHEDCSVVKDVGDLTTKFIEVGFAALGAGIMALAIDLHSKEALDNKHRDLLRRYSKILNKEKQWQQAFNKFGEELDQIESVQRMERYLRLKEIHSNIEFDKDELSEDFAKWELDFHDKH